MTCNQGLGNTPLQATTTCAQQQPLSLHFPYQAGVELAPVSHETTLSLTHNKNFCLLCLCMQEALLPAGQCTPGPSDYRADSRPTLPGKPAFTIAGRHSHSSTKHSTPGPGAYAVRGNSKTVGCHPNAPGYSMPAGGRPTLQSHTFPGPGGKPPFYHLHASCRQGSQCCLLVGQLICCAPWCRQASMCPADRNTSSPHSVTKSHLATLCVSLTTHCGLPSAAACVSVCRILHRGAGVGTTVQHEVQA